MVLWSLLWLTDFRFKRLLRLASMMGLPYVNIMVTIALLVAMLRAWLLVIENLQEGGPVQRLPDFIA